MSSDSNGNGDEYLNMSAQVICVVLDTGIPLFARQSEQGTPTVSFPVAAALNGSKLFGMEKSVELLSAITGNCRVVWREFQNTYALIVVARDDDISEFHLSNFLDMAFNAMVMMVGLENLLDTSNREKLKKEVRKAYPLIDHLLEGLGPLDGKVLQVGDLVQCPDRLCSHENLATHVDYITSFSERVKCHYGALSCNQVLIGATKKWWSVNPIENYLLVALSHLSKELISEQIVFLPISSPKVPFRLVVIKVRTMRMSFLCGKTEKVSVLHKEARRMKKHPPTIFEDIETARSNCDEAKRFFEKCPNISAFMFVNVQLERCGAFVLKDDNEEDNKVGSRLEALRAFYRNTVDTIFPWRVAVPNKTDGEDPERPKENKVLEAYMRSDYMNCHAMRSAQLQIYAIYEDEIGMSQIRSSSRSLFCEVMHDKNF